MGTYSRLTKGMFVMLAMVGPTLAHDGSAAAVVKSATAGQHSATRIVLQYGAALAGDRVAEWAALDLGCLTLRRERGVSEQTDRACWDDTLKVHRELVQDQPETGIFEAVGRGVGFGLLSETHRHADYWKDYMPAVLVSPAAIGKDGGPGPALEILKVSPVRQFALRNLTGLEPVRVSGHTVEVRVSYLDPLTAPLALRPGEVWWASSTLRRYGPVRELAVRFVVVSGLRRLGYPVDQAVVNEALPGAPVQVGIHYGRLPQTTDPGGQHNEALKNRLGAGGLVLGSARWWDRKDAHQAFAAGLVRAQQMPHSPERTRLLTRLTLIDHADQALHTVIAHDRLQTFLREGLTKSGISGSGEAVTAGLAELYWNLQAQTWRQELTEVAMGHSAAAEAFYQAIESFERVTAGGQMAPEERRQLGVLYRWNNDATAALAVHEALLKDTTSANSLHGRVLSDLAWDRIQWLSWERRYGHPWLEQARQEAEQAVQEVKDPVDKLIAAYALVLVEALRVPREPAQLEERFQIVKTWHDRISGAAGVWPYLIGNDIVKALVPEGAQVLLPRTDRASDVSNVEIHAEPPRQDIVWQWNFDQDLADALPRGFVALSTPGADSPGWRVLPDGQTPTLGQLVVQDRPCATGECAHLLLADRVRTTYPDIVVQIQDLSADGGGEAGIALAARDNKNFYAVTLNASTGRLTTRRVFEGRTTVLGETTVKLSQRPWHSLRVQRINFIHLDRGRLGVFVDGAQVTAVDDTLLPEGGLIGLVTVGRTTAKFDSLHVLDLVSNRPLSGHAAY
ncbi:MAG: hypothetical protein H8K10_16140 [Nitrospira sp.]|nr:hypothetical protein [Nitrospira sp.]